MTETAKAAHGRAFGYAVAGLAMSLDEQKASLVAYFQQHLKRLGVDWAGIVVEPAANGPPDLRSKPEGCRMLSELTAGDHVIIADVDMAFPTIDEWSHALQHFAPQGVFIHAVDQMRGLFEIDQQCRQQRQRDVNAIRRLKRLATHGNPPLGFKMAGPSGQRRYVTDEDALETMRWIVEQYDKTNNGFRAISTWLTKNRVMWKKHDKQARSGFTWEFWTPQKVGRAYRRMKQIEDVEKRNSTGGMAVSAATATANAG